MKSLAPIFLILAATLLVTGCSGDAVKRATYEAAYQKNCIDQTGAANCDPAHKDYDTYRKERDQALHSE